MKEKIEIKMFHGKSGVEITYSGLLGITDLITEDPYIEPQSSNNFSVAYIIFAPAIDISEEEYKDNPSSYVKTINALNDLYIDYLKTSEKFGEKYESSDPFYRRYAVKETIKNNLHEQVENYIKENNFRNGLIYPEDTAPLSPFKGYPSQPTLGYSSGYIDTGKYPLSSHSLIFTNYTDDEAD